jgi:hypothetical protein
MATSHSCKRACLVQQQVRLLRWLLLVAELLEQRSDGRGWRLAEQQRRRRKLLVRVLLLLVVGTLQCLVVQRDI